MGWASAGDIFDPVAQALIDAGVPDACLREVLGPLIDNLQNQDWDTEDESLDRFADNLTIRSLFYNANVGGDLGEHSIEGRIRYVDSDGGQWILGCDRCGRLDHAPFTASGHDLLILAWAAHEQDIHGTTSANINNRLITTTEQKADR